MLHHDLSHLQTHSAQAVVLYFDLDALPLLNILYAPAQVPRSHLRSETESCTICEKYSPHPTATPPHTCDWLHSSYGCERLLAHQDCTLDELTSFIVLRFNSHSRVYLQGASQKHTRWRRDAVVSAVASQKQGCGFDSVGWLVPLCGICMFSLRLNEYSLLCCGCSKRIYERTIIKTNRM